MARVGRLTACLALVLLAWSSTALPTRAVGAPLTYRYSGAITAADPSTGVSPGAPFSGTFTYDPDAPNPLLMTIEGMNQYLLGRSPGDLASLPDASESTLAVDGQTVHAYRGGVGVSVAELEYEGQYGYARKPYTSVGISNAMLGDPMNLTLDLRFENPDRAVFRSLALPALLRLSDLPRARLRVTADATTPRTHTLYEGTIETLTVVPEPLAIAVWLCLNGLGVAFSRIWRVRKIER